MVREMFDHAFIKPTVRWVLRIAYEVANRYFRPEHDTELGRKLHDAFVATGERCSFICPDHVKEYFYNVAWIIRTYASMERLYFPLLYNVLVEELDKRGLLKKQKRPRGTPEIEKMIRENLGDQY